MSLGKNNCYLASMKKFIMYKLMALFLNARQFKFWCTILMIILTCDENKLLIGLKDSQPHLFNLTQYISGYFNYLLYLSISYLHLCIYADIQDFVRHSSLYFMTDLILCLTSGCDQMNINCLQRIFSTDKNQHIDSLWVLHAIDRRIELYPTKEVLPLST